MSRHKREVFEQLIYEIRRSQEATARFDDAVAEAIGVNRTDMRCLDHIQREGRITAGRLAELTGLTTGAMTAALDRLERSGLARRIRDPDDRRKVLVEPGAEAASGAVQYYGEHVRQSERLYHRYTEEQLELLLEFIRQGREFNEVQAAKLEQRNRARSPLD